jgi:repressor LexA
MALTPRQKEVLDFLVTFVEDNGYSPSYEELAIGLNLASLATVHKHISALESRGYLKRGFNQSRSLDVSAEYVTQHRQNHKPVASRQTYEVPLAGKIAAGTPVDATQQQETLSFGDFVGNDSTFALQVRGESMIDDHIMHGDYVLVEKTDRVRDGEIVVALVDGNETTLKRFYRETDGVARLQPANASMEPIRVPLDSVFIQGRVLAVLRKYK